MITQLVKVLLRLWPFTLAAVLLLACRTPVAAPGSREWAIAAAQKYAREQWGWNKIRVIRAQRDDAQWMVILTTLPIVFGGDVSVWLAPDGSVTQIQTGK